MTVPISEAMREMPMPASSVDVRVRSTAARKKPATSIVVAPDPDEGLQQGSNQWNTIYGFLFSTAVHAILLIVLALIAFETTGNDVGSLIGLLGKDDTDTPAEFILDSQLENDPGGSPEEALFAPSSVLLGDNGVVGPAVDSQFGGEGLGEGAGDGEGDGVGVSVPTLKVPGYAVTKGSFSAWTEPEDPKPGEAYFITIQVRLPENVAKGKTYPVKDISGMVIGTDGYKKVIRFRPNEKIEVQDGVIEFKLQIPGAAQLVKDTIRIQSRMLKEKQTITLVF